MSSGAAREEGPVTGLGLEAWEIRGTGRTIAGSVYATALGGAFAAVTIGAHWVLLAYAAGAAVALGTLRADRAAEAGSRLRRVLARTCEWDLRFFVFLAMTLAAFKALSAFMIEPVLLPMTGLWDPEMTKAEVAAAFEEAARGALARAKPWALGVGVSGVVFGLLSGIADWLWLGALGERLGVRPWRVLFGREARRDRREAAARERTRRRHLLRGRGQ